MTSTDISILGSCVSRDTFAAYPETLPGPAEYFARSALASALSEIPVLDVDLSTIDSAFQRRVVAFDLEGAFFSYVTRGFDGVLVYDAIDERFEVLLLGDGGLVTVSNEYRSATAAPDIAERIAPWTERYYELWESAWTKLVVLLRDSGSINKLVVNKVYWADRVADGGMFPRGFTPTGIQRANDFLDRLYQRMAADISEDRFLVYRPDDMVAASEHKWGRSPFHYVERYYASMEEQLVRVSQQVASANADEMEVGEAVKEAVEVAQAVSKREARRTWWGFFRR